MRISAIAALLLCFAAPVRADTVMVAAASNFNHALRDIAAAFEAQSSHRVRLSLSSTGKLYAQSMNGAPYDVFIAADAERPAMLEAAGRTAPGSRFTFAYGQLTLWSVDPRFAGADCAERFGAGDFRRAAIANPVTAPYGVAAVEAMAALGQARTELEGRLVYGENVAQTLQFVATGSADIGLVARSLLHAANLPSATCRWDVPAELHAPLVHDAVLMARGADNTAARAFVAYLRGGDAQAILREYGYRVD